jgi:hypothetical protein
MDLNIQCEYALWEPLTAICHQGAWLLTGTLLAALVGCGACAQAVLAAHASGVRCHAECERVQAMTEISVTPSAAFNALQ